MRKNIVIIISLLILLLCLSLFYYVTNDKTKIIAEAPKTSLSEQAEAYSRISFFNSSPARVSLAIPESWEGNYRLETKNEQVNFLFIGEPNKIIKLFDIKYILQRDWPQQDFGQEFFRKKAYVYVYNLEQNKGLSEQYEKMYGQIKNIISSIN